MSVEDRMTEDGLAEQICNDFEVASIRWKNREFHELMGVVVFYEAALRVTRAKPFRPEIVQIKVVAFLEKRLLQACEELIAAPLAVIRKRIQREGNI